jgi:hypothetical protein
MTGKITDNLGRASGLVKAAAAGRTGTVDWVTTPQTGTVTAATGKGYFINTTSGGITVNLPAGAAGSIVSMADYARTWDTNNVTVSPNGSEKIGSSTDDAVLNTEGQSVTLIYIDSTQGWLNVQDSTSNVVGGTFIQASGGNQSTATGCVVCSNYKVHKFTSPGTLTVSGAASCAADNIVSHLIVAGGGGGGGGCGSGYCAGGAGAGGFREVDSPTAPYTASPLDGYPSAPNRITLSASPGSYSIVVGAGGTGAPGTVNTAPAGGDGTVSSFGGITSAGGGGGGSRNTPSGGVYEAHDGGSGGGAGQADNCAQSNTFGAGNTPPTTPSQGNNGGRSSYPIGSPSDSGSGGGGGATTVGGNSAPGTAVGGVGGTGATSEISGSPVVYAGGGGGAGTPASGGTAGSGGGGTGSGPGQATTSGDTNTGGGGGAGSGASCRTGGTGGPGVVWIRYKYK